MGRPDEGASQLAFKFQLVQMPAHMQAAGTWQLRAVPGWPEPAREVGDNVSLTHASMRSHSLTTLRLVILV